MLVPCPRHPSRRPRPASMLSSLTPRPIAGAGVHARRVSSTTATRAWCIGVFHYSLMQLLLLQTPGHMTTESRCTEFDSGHECRMTADDMALPVLKGLTPPSSGCQRAVLHSSTARKEQKPPAPVQWITTKAHTRLHGPCSAQQAGRQIGRLWVPLNPDKLPPAASIPPDRLRWQAPHVSLPLYMLGISSSSLSSHLNSKPLLVQQGSPKLVALICQREDSSS